MKFGDLRQMIDRTARMLHQDRGHIRVHLSSAVCAHFAQTDSSLNSFP